MEISDYRAKSTIWKNKVYGKTKYMEKSDTLNWKSLKHYPTPTTKKKQKKNVKIFCRYKKRFYLCGVVKG